MSYYSKILFPFVESLVNDHLFIEERGVFDLNVNDLDPFELQEFAKHMMVHFDYSLGCLYENDDHDEIGMELSKLMDSGDIDSNISFVHLLRNKIVNFYKPRMQLMIDEIVGQLEQDHMESGGYQITKDNVTGENLWIRG